MRYNKIFIGIILIMIFLTGCTSHFNSNRTKVQNGILDLTDWHMDGNSTIKLNGTWEFYWNKFLTYDDLSNNKPDTYVSVPKAWNEYSINGKKLPGQGYATYKLHVKTDLPSDTLLGLQVGTFSSAYKIYINNKLIASNGTTSDNAEKEVGQYKPQIAIFETPAKEFDILIQVSNFEFAKGGFWDSVIIGSNNAIIGLHEKNIIKELLLIGALLFVSLLYLSTFILNRDLKHCLYYSCLTIFIAIILDISSQIVLLNRIPGLSFKHVIFIWFTANNWLIFFLILFVHELFKSKVSTIIVKAYFIGFAILQIVYLATNPLFYSKFTFISEIMEPLGALCAIIIILVGIKKGYKDGLLNLISMFIALVTYIHDSLYWTNMITSSVDQVIYTGLFLFIVMQIIIQANRVRKSHDNKKAIELAFLQSQIKPHFLYNCLNTFISVSYDDVDKARDLIRNFAEYLRRSFDFKDLNEFVSLENEIELAKAYVEIQKVRFEERLEVIFEVPDDIQMKVPFLMLQPLIENAVVHGVLPKPEGGSVVVSIKNLGKMLQFKVIDNGVGMDLNSKLNLINVEFQSGVGIANIQSRLKKIFGKGLDIKSKPNEGTEVTWYIPINKWR